MRIVIRIAGQVAVTIWLGIAACAGIGIAYDVGNLWGAIPMGLFLLIAGAFLEGIIFSALKDEFGDQP